MIGSTVVEGLHEARSSGVDDSDIVNPDRRTLKWMKAWPVALLIAPLLLVGCSGDEDKPSGSAGTEADSAEYASTRDLAADLDKSKSDTCTVWVQDDDDEAMNGDGSVSPTLLGSASSASCSDPEARIAVFSSTSSRDSGVGMVNANWSDPVAVGVNWFYVGPDAEAVAEEFGTEVVQPEFAVD